MSELRREVGFLRSLSSQSLGSLLWPEGLIAIVVGVGGGVCLIQWDSVAERSQLVGEVLTVVALLLGITFTAFSLLISLMSKDYMILLNEADEGFVAFTRPFVVALGLQVSAVVIAIAYMAAAPHLPRGVEKSVFVVWALLSAYVTVDILALGRNIAMHGLMRTRQVVSQAIDESGRQKVQHIDRKTNL